MNTTRKIQAHKFGGDILDDATLRGYNLGDGDIGKYAALQHGYVCLGVGNTADEALAAATSYCGGDDVVDDVAEKNSPADDGDVEVVLIEGCE